jgi:hypothetical protein
MIEWTWWGVGVSVAAKMGIDLEEWEQCLGSVAARLWISPKLANSLECSSSGDFHCCEFSVGTLEKAWLSGRALEVAAMGVVLEEHVLWMLSLNIKHIN